HSLAQSLLDLLGSFAGLFAIFTVDEDHPHLLSADAQDRNVSHFFLPQKSQLSRQVIKKSWNIHYALMIGDNHIGLLWIEMLSAFHLESYTHGAKPKHNA